MGSSKSLHLGYQHHLDAKLALHTCKSAAAVAIPSPNRHLGPDPPKDLPDHRCRMSFRSRAYIPTKKSEITSGHRTHGTVGCTTLADPRAQDAQAAWMRHTIRLCERLISGRQPSNNRQQPNQLRYCFSHPYRPQNLDHAYKTAHSANRLPHTLARRPFYIVPACRSCSSSAAPMPISPSTESVCSPRRGAVAPGRSGVALMRIGVPTTRRASPSSFWASAK